jgi:ribosomal protein S18 acetylase RimI-like enzyme
MQIPASAVRVRELQPGDLARLQRDLPSSHHPPRVEQHESGAATFLIVERDDTVAGYLLIKWHGADEEIVHRLIGDWPELNAITVAPAFQSRGIGTALINAAELRVAARGFTCLGLAVGIENPRARALYERLGYRAWEHGVFNVSWHVPGDPPRRESENCIYMLKQLQMGRRRA